MESHLISIYLFIFALHNIFVVFKRIIPNSWYVRLLYKDWFKWLMIVQRLQSF